MMKRLAPLVLIATSLGGCANGSDPLNAIADSSTTPSLGLPFVLTSATITNQIEFSSSTPYLEWTFGTAAPVSPAAGIVTAIDGTSGAASVTIYHSAHLSTQVSKLLSVSVRVGDVLSAGQSIGGVTGTARFSVLLDGTTVCPLTFLNSDSKVVVNGNDGGGDICT
jgi:hypothetical protein